MVDIKTTPEEIYRKYDIFGLENSINMLIELAETNQDNKIRGQAIYYLGKLAKNSKQNIEGCFEFLENVLVSDNNPEIKSLTAEAIGKMKYDKSIKPLKWIYEQESSNNDVKLAALKAIVNTRFDDSEIRFFIKELDCKYQSIKEKIKNELITLDPELLIRMLLEGIKNEDFCESHKIEIVNLVGLELSSLNVNFEDSNFVKIKYPNIITSLEENKKILLEIIVPNLKEEDQELMNNILSILKLLGKNINKNLIKFLDHDDFIIKKNAIKLIGKLQIGESAEILLKNVDDIYEDVNRCAIEALGEIGDIKVVPKLLNILNIEDYSYEYIDLDMKWFILDSIKKIYLNPKNKNAIFDDLLILLDSNNDILKESIAYLFGELGYSQFVEPLIKLLSEKHLDTRKNAAIALGKIGSINSIEPLLNIVNDENNYWILKKVAVDAIYNIYLRHLFIEQFKNSVEAKRFFTRSTQKLIDYLNQTKDHCKVKLSVIKLLEIFGNKTAINALMKQINDFHRIVQISSTKAIKTIEKRLKKQEEKEEQK